MQFHQTLIKMTGSKILQETTENILLHVRGIRKITIGRDDRASQSIKDHLAIIAALEKRDTELAEQLCRDHTLGLAAYVEKHSEGIWTETSWSAPRRRSDDTDRYPLSLGGGEKGVTSLPDSMTPITLAVPGGPQVLRAQRWCPSPGERGI